MSPSSELKVYGRINTVCDPTALYFASEAMILIVSGVECLQQQL
jgi:hypothetical protein